MSFKVAVDFDDTLFAWDNSHHVIDLIKTLIKGGAEIHIITARNEKECDDVYEYADALNIKRGNIVFTDHNFDKHLFMEELGIQLLIDDNWQIIHNVNHIYKGLGLLVGFDAHRVTDEYKDSGVKEELDKKMESFKQLQFEHSVNVDYAQHKINYHVVLKGLDKSHYVITAVEQGEENGIKTLVYTLADESQVTTSQIEKIVYPSLDSYLNLEYFEKNVGKFAVVSGYLDKGLCEIKKAFITRINGYESAAYVIKTPDGNEQSIVQFQIFKIYDTPDQPLTFPIK